MSAGHELLKFLVIYRLPYRDPLRRRRMRAEARKLISLSIWPGESATPDQVAQLALLRLLALQREARRATRHHLYDSAALAARNSIETYLIGRYCLSGSQGLDHLNAHNNQALRQILRYLPEAIVSKEALTSMLNGLGKSEKAKPLTEIAKVIDAATGTADSSVLYDAFYPALSTFYAHGRGLALLRQVGRRGRIRRQPQRAWGRQSPLHLADALVAQLAAALAERSGAMTDDFVAYAEAHRKRVVVPILSLGGGAFASIEWARFPTAVLTLVKLRKYLNGEGKRHSPAEREQRLRTAMDEILAVLSAEGAEDARALVTDSWVAQILAGTGETSPEMPASE